MASSEDSRKRALADEDDESSGLDSASHGDSQDPSESEPERPGQQWSSKTELEDSTQVVGQPVFTSDDPTGFGETTQSMRLDSGRAAAAPGDFESEPTRVGSTSDWTPGAPEEDETRPGRAGGAATLGTDDASGFSSAGSTGSFDDSRPHAHREDDSPRSSSSGGLPEFGASGHGASFDFGTPPSGSDTTDPGHSPSSAPGTDIPAHLQLPNMDFALPKLPDFGSAPPVGDNSGADLPLPNFPDLGLGLPPVGASPDEGAPPDEGAAAGSTAFPSGDAGPPGSPPRRRTTGSEAPPAPPPRRSTGGEQPLPTAFGMPEDLALPDLAPPPTKRNLTLISMPQDTDDEGSRRVVWPFIVIAVLALVTVLGVWQKDRLLAVMVPKKKPPVPVVVPPTPQELAKTAFAGGVHAFAAKEYPKAIESFEKAVSLDASLADAHRSLGIVYATTHEQAKAVEHYKRYLELTPKAPDAAAVQKIVDDYGKAQAKPATPPPEEPEKTKQKGKRAKGKRRS